MLTRIWGFSRLLRVFWLLRIFGVHMSHTSYKQSDSCIKSKCCFHHVSQLLCLYEIIITQVCLLFINFMLILKGLSNITTLLYVLHISCSPLIRIHDTPEHSLCHCVFVLFLLVYISFLFNVLCVFYPITLCCLIIIFIFI